MAARPRAKRKNRGQARAAMQQRPTLKTQEISLEQLRKFAESGYLFAIFDSCDAPIVPPKMSELGESKAVSLFKGSAQQDYWAIAPYLAQIDLSLFDWIFENLWNQPWGIFMLGKGAFREYYEHFRKFLIVNMPDGKNWFFRYYDPRVLQLFLPTCTEKELVSFCGPVRAYVIANTDRNAKLAMLMPK